MGLGIGSARGRKVHALERGLQLGVAVAVEGVEVGAHGAGEEDGVLRDDGKAGAEVVELDGCYVEAVDEDAAVRGVDESKQCQNETRLASACFSVSNAVRFKISSSVLPVRPTTPTRSPGSMEKARSFRTGGESGE